MYLQTNGDFEEATLFSFQKGPICKKMGISTGFYWFFLSFTVHTLQPQVWAGNQVSKFELKSHVEVTYIKRNHKFRIKNLITQEKSTCLSKS